MLNLVSRLNLALVLFWATISHGAVIEIEPPDARMNQAATARFLQWQALPRNAGFLAGAVNAAPGRKTRDLADAAALVHVANTPVSRAGGDDFSLYQEYYWQSKSGMAAAPGSFEESMQKTEVWPIIVIGIGLVAYQLRRQSRNRAGIVRIMSQHT